MADGADDATVTRCSKRQEEYPIEDVDRLAFLRIMTSARSLGCCRIKHGESHPEFWTCQECLHVYRCLRVRNTSQGSERSMSVRMPRWDCPVTLDDDEDACDDHFLISAMSVTLLSRPLSASKYTNFA